MEPGSRPRRNSIFAFFFFIVVALVVVGAFTLIQLRA